MRLEEQVMQMRKLGKSGPAVSSLGLGTMGMSDLYGPADDNESVATIQAALDAGITLLDTADFYGVGHNEMLIAKAIGGRRDKAFIQVKFGVLREPGGAWAGLDLRPAAVKNALAYSLRRLNTDYVDLYQPARVPHDIPIEDVVGAMSDLVKAGHVRHVGLSEAGPDTIRRAHAVHPITAIQTEYSLMSRGLEAKLLPLCRELGIGLTTYGVLSRGLLSGRVGTQGFAGRRDFRAGAPRFQGANLEKNRALVAKLAEVATARGATPAQLAIAWALTRGDDIVALIGARTRKQLEESLGALQLRLDPADVAAIDSAVPAAAVAGARYDEHGMRMLDSER
jgi:aryl-alcohol dehydrogenase-like predicted oxidoreductase